MCCLPSIQSNSWVPRPSEVHASTGSDRDPPWGLMPLKVQTSTGSRTFLFSSWKAKFNPTTLLILGYLILHRKQKMLNRITGKSSPEIHVTTYNYIIMLVHWWKGKSQQIISESIYYSQIWVVLIFLKTWKPHNFKGDELSKASSVSSSSWLSKIAVSKAKKQAVVPSWDLAAQTFNIGMVKESS